MLLQILIFYPKSAGNPKKPQNKRRTVHDGYKKSVFCVDFKDVTLSLGQNVTKKVIPESQKFKGLVIFSGKHFLGAILQKYDFFTLIISCFKKKISVSV
jgi:hypothetical protein